MINSVSFVKILTKKHNAQNRSLGLLLIHSNDPVSTLICADTSRSPRSFLPEIKKQKVLVLDSDGAAQQPDVPRSGSQSVPDQHARHARRRNAQSETSAKSVAASLLLYMSFLYYGR